MPKIVCVVVCENACRLFAMFALQPEGKKDVLDKLLIIPEYFSLCYNLF